MSAAHVITVVTRRH